MTEPDRPANAPDDTAKGWAQPGVAGEGFQRVHPVSPFLRVGILILAGVVALVRELAEGVQLLGVVVIGGTVVVGGLVYGFCAWWFTRFRIEPEEVRIDSGVFVRRSRRISLERLQAVDVVQPFLARIFGMAELRFEVAGGSESEAPLAFLRLDDAHRLRAVILELGEELPHAAVPYPRPPVSAEPGGEAPAPPRFDTAEAEGRVAPVEREILAVRPQWLVVGTLLSTELIVSALLMVVFLAAVGVLAYLIEDAEIAVFLPGGLAIGFTTILGAGTALARHLVNQWGFVLSETAGGWRLRRGLFDLRTQTVLLDRIQGFVVQEPLLWRRAELVRVEVDIAGYTGSSGDNSTSTPTLLPAVPKAVAYDVLARLGHGSRLGEIPVRGAPRRARLFRPVGWRYFAAGATDRVAVTVRGWMLRRTDIVPHHKTQSVHLHQGPTQRRLGLADVHIHTTPGPCNAVAKHRSVDEARALVTEQLERARRARAGT
ncbi:MAG: PH domain-containing protein [Propionibacteriales bacterium]|nr:PH domain-containing protein [Propionibacteriales bacterium]